MVRSPWRITTCASSNWSAAAPIGCAAVGVTKMMKNSDSINDHMVAIAVKNDGNVDGNVAM